MQRPRFRGAPGNSLLWNGYFFFFVVVRATFAWADPPVSHAAQ
jgi:hypothetical protein